MRFMNKKFINELSPLIKDSQSWTAFLCLMDHQINKTINKLEGKPSTEDLIRINAEYNLLQLLKKQRDIIINAEKSL